MAFHARLLADAQTVLRRRPEQPAKARVDAMAFDMSSFGTVPGSAAAASRMAGWAAQSQNQLARVGAEVAALEQACGTTKNMALDVDATTAATALRGQAD